MQKKYLLISCDARDLRWKAASCEEGRDGFRSQREMKWPLVQGVAKRQFRRGGDWRGAACKKNALRPKIIKPMLRCWWWDQAFKKGYRMESQHFGFPIEIQWVWYLFHFFSNKETERTRILLYHLSCILLHWKCSNFAQITITQAVAGQLDPFLPFYVPSSATSSASEAVKSFCSQPLKVEIVFKRGSGDLFYILEMFFICVIQLE